ncbi:hypothetical protein [Lentibacillus sp. CBA3610]|uniref:hypothetical protein n=1 Tax=Lentibacillus sp. CBA3610 TaxID=2518176 RepID=UPI0020D246BA|nr:hypothetical protein [Lentibacillus sp. CBA3610]
MNVPEMGLVQDSMGGYHFAVKKRDSGNRIESSGFSKDKSTEKNYFEGTLKGNKIDLTGVKIEEILYTKRSPVETARLRKKFNHSVRKRYLKEFANDQSRVQYLRKAGLND